MYPSLYMWLRPYLYLYLYWSFGFLILYRSFYSFGCTAGNKTEFLESATLTEEEFQERPIINWDAILYVNRPTELWAVQLILALISLTEAMLLTYLGYKVSNRRLSLSFLMISTLFHSLPSIHFFLSLFVLYASHFCFESVPFDFYDWFSIVSK